MIQAAKQIPYLTYAWGHMTEGSNLTRVIQYKTCIASDQVSQALPLLEIKDQQKKMDQEACSMRKATCIRKSHHVEKLLLVQLSTSLQLLPTYQSTGNQRRQSWP